MCLQRAPHYSMIGTPDYEEWKSFRKTCSLAFSPDNMRKVTPVITYTEHARSDWWPQRCLPLILIAWTTLHAGCHKQSAATQLACKHGNCPQYHACDTVKAGKHVVKHSSFLCVQAYPKIYQSILQGSAAVQQICKHGPVDVSSLAMRLTAGIVPLTNIRPYRHAWQPM